MVSKILILCQVPGGTKCCCSKTHTLISNIRDILPLYSFLSPYILKTTRPICILGLLPEYHSPAYLTFQIRYLSASQIQNGSHYPHSQPSLFFVMYVWMIVTASTSFSKLFLTFCFVFLLFVRSLNSKKKGRIIKYADSGKHYSRRFLVQFLIMFSLDALPFFLWSLLLYLWIFKICNYVFSRSFLIFKVSYPKYLDIFTSTLIIFY